MLEPRAVNHRYAGLITLCGSVVILATFLVKDVLRERAKDLLDALDYAKSQWTISQTVLGIGVKIHEFAYNIDQGQSPPARLRSHHDQTEFKRWMVLAYLNTVDEKFQAIEDLWAQLPKRLRVDESSLRDEKRALDGYAQDLFSMGQIPSETVIDELRRDKDVADAYGAAEYANAMATLQGNLSLQVFERETAHVARQLRTFTYVSYLLYIMGIAIAFLGQLLGVSAAGAHN